MQGGQTLTFEACMSFSAEAPGFLQFQDGTSALVWAHTKLNKSKKWFVATSTEVPDDPAKSPVSLAIIAKTAGKNKIKGDGAQSDGTVEGTGLITFTGPKDATCAAGAE